MIAERQKALNKNGGYSKDKKQEFLEIVAKYCDKDASEITDDLRFREDLGFNSLSFMTYLGDLEDTFDVELEEEEAIRITTIGERLAAIESDLPKPEIGKQLMGENLEYIFSGGAHLDPAYISLFEEYGIKVCEGYGMSECSPTISSNGQTGNRPGSVGKVLANMQVRFVDGEIQVKGSNVMKGYYKMPKETEEAFSDGWLRTGDLGRMDEDGYLYITGRLKNLIILSNGENISPEEVENALLTHDLVGEVVISGEENGLAARIYPDPDVVEAKALSPEDVAAQLQGTLDDYNKTQPLYRAITTLKVRKFPFVKNATKKIVRAKMDVDEAPEE